MITEIKKKKEGMILSSNTKKFAGMTIRNELTMV